MTTPNAKFSGDRNGVLACAVKCAQRIAQESTECRASTATSG
jgi:hypothetical protein